MRRFPKEIHTFHTTYHLGDDLLHPGMCLSAYSQYAGVYFESRVRSEYTRAHLGYSLSILKYTLIVV